MISSVHGTVLHVAVDSVVVSVGGVGFSVAVPTDVARATHVGNELLLHTHLVVREDALSLFGFATRDELEVFVILIGVTGVGPKSGLGILSSLSVEQIAAAVAAEDETPFRKVSGIGPKTAKLIVVQLAGKLHAPVASPGARASAPDIASQVIAALTGLGWAERVAAESVQAVLADAPESERGDVPALLRRTLAALGPAKQAARG